MTARGEPPLEYGWRGYNGGVVFREAKGDEASGGVG